MSFLKIAKMKQSIRKMLLLPIGIFFSMAGVAWIVYFYSPTMLAQEAMNRILLDTTAQTEEAYRDNPKLNSQFKDKILQVVNDLRRGDTSSVLIRVDELRGNPECRTSRGVFLATKSLKEAVAANDYQRYWRNMLFIGGGILALGVLVLVYGFLQVRQSGVFISSDQLMSNMTKFEPPDVPHKETLKKQNIKHVTVMITVNRFGHVTDIEMMDGPTHLLPYLIQAARKWRFDPFLHKGKSVPVMGEMKVHLK